jgi:hypothetical protein
LSSSIFGNDLNTKFYQNVASGSVGVDLGGYWETFYDSSPTSSLSTALFDVTYGYHTSSVYYVNAYASSSINQKNKVYKMMASQLLGNADSTFTINSVAATEAFFIMPKRNIQKDEIKKGATSIVFLTTGSNPITGSDAGAVTSFFENVGGDYAYLLSGTTQIGQVWYNAGVIVVQPNQLWSFNTGWSGSLGFGNAQYSGTINQLVDGLRKYGVSGTNQPPNTTGNGGIQLLSFHNQTNLFSTVYFCRAKNTDFNYSSHPTFVDTNQRIRVTSGSNILQTRTYITTIGLYDASDNLLAVAKVSKPITKSPDNEAIFRIRLDY